MLSWSGKEREREEVKGEKKGVVEREGGGEGNEGEKERKEGGKEERRKGLGEGKGEEEKKEVKYTIRRQSQMGIRERRKWWRREVRTSLWHCIKKQAGH